MKALRWTAFALLLLTAVQINGWKIAFGIGHGAYVPIITFSAQTED